MEWMDVDTGMEWNGWNFQSAFRSVCSVFAAIRSAVVYRRSTRVVGNGTV